MAVARPGGAHAQRRRRPGGWRPCRVNGQRIDAASRAVRAGDVVTVALDRTVRVMRVIAFAERRGGRLRLRGSFSGI